VNGCHINRDRTAAAIARNVESDCVTRPESGYGRPVAAANPEGNIRGGAIYPDDDQTVISLETLDYRCGHGDTLCPRSCADQTKGDLSVKIRDVFAADIVKLLRKQRRPAAHKQPVLRSRLLLLPLRGVGFPIKPL
jgi:hypothetical protein